MAEIVQEVIEETIPIMADVLVEKDLKNDVIRHRLDLEHQEADTQLKTCTGLTTDKRLVVLLASVIISFIVVTFSCYMLAANKLDCSSQHTYVGLLTLIIGIWLKSPL